jgi:diaminohydroxyphosphoribosylaminopyrimidine deaminase/5-amino-6-(5-phosphoribosylamino)uracil reductase
MVFDLQNSPLKLPKDKEILTDDQALQLALQQAFKGAGFVSPNPLVGCVILSKKNEFLSIGYHEKVGEAHAEINALNDFYKKISDYPSTYKLSDLVDARVFVTLEPCAHQGRTGSCAKKLAELPIAEVVYCLKDPNPLVIGKGKLILKEAGKKVTVLEEEKTNDYLIESSKMLCEHFLHNFENQKVFFSLKIASSLDGMLAMKSGESKWITGALAREYSHWLRLSHDAVLVGSNTIAIDDPSLDIRIDDPTKFFLDSSKISRKKNKIIIIDPNARILKQLNQYKISKVHDLGDLIFVVNNKYQIDFGDLKPTVVCFQDSSLALDFLDKQLWDLGVRSVLVEGGAKTLSQFLQQKTGQRLYLFQAPIMLGGKNGKTWSEDLLIENLNSKISLKNQLVKILGPDVLISGKLNFNSQLKSLNQIISI